MQGVADIYEYILYNLNNKTHLLITLTRPMFSVSIYVRWSALFLESVQLLLGGIGPLFIGNNNDRVRIV